MVLFPCTELLFHSRQKCPLRLEGYKVGSLLAELAEQHSLFSEIPGMASAGIHCLLEYLCLKHD